MVISVKSTMALVAHVIRELVLLSIGVRAKRSGGNTENFIILKHNWLF